MTIPDLTLATWLILTAAAVLVGVSKTAIPGINTLSIAAFAAVLPARSSTGALLLLLLIGDIFALLAYRKHAHWPTLIRLIPAVIAGVALGALFLAFADDGWVRRVIGGILLLVVVITVWQRSWKPAERVSTVGGPPAGTSQLASVSYGTLGGFTTMVANAGGPVMSMYFLAARFPVHAFLGTAAWFFAVINFVKLPISIGLGLITPELTLLALYLAPAVVVGALLGRWIAARIPQHVFDRAVIVCTVLGATYLLVAP